jgi:hypothetical protein
MPWIGPESTSPRDLDLLAVATRPFVLGADAFFLLADFFTLVDFFEDDLLLLAGFLRLGAFLACFFLLEDFFFAAGILREAFFLATAFFPAAFFFAAGFFRTAALREDFFFDNFFLVTLAFFPEDFFLDGDFRDAAFLREAADLARLFVEAFLAAISCSCRSEKNAGLYIDCCHMEARKQGFFSLFLCQPGRTCRGLDFE